jgi:hypothetical protein
VPDVDRHVTERLAAGVVDDLDVQVEPNPALALGDVLADPLAVEVVRAFLLLSDERASGRRREGLVFEVLVTEKAQPGQAEAGAAESAQRAAAGESESVV